jgi:CRISPR-associated protein (TIGR03984 family)
MTRSINSVQAAVSIESVNLPDNLINWLIAQAGDTEFFLLAHLDDGVLWGRVGNGEVITGHDVVEKTNPKSPILNYTPMLRLKTLQTLRLFNESAEGMLWRVPDDLTSSWYWRWMWEVENETDAYFHWAFEEAHLLWGTNFQPINHQFTLATDGAEGLRHVVPIPVPAGDYGISGRPLRLRMRHYIEPDFQGCARVSASRLLKLEVL